MHVGERGITRGYCTPGVNAVALPPLPHPQVVPRAVLLVGGGGGNRCRRTSSSLPHVA
jgi:hypothetical protein